MKIDSKIISFKVRVNPDPNITSQETDQLKYIENCIPNEDIMKYKPVRMTFYHYDKSTSRRKLLWHDSDAKEGVSWRNINNNTPPIDYKFPSGMIHNLFIIFYSRLTFDVVWCIMKRFRHLVPGMEQVVLLCLLDQYQQFVSVSNSEPTEFWQRWSKHQNTLKNGIGYHL